MTIWKDIYDVQFVDACAHPTTPLNLSQEPTHIRIKSMADGKWRKYYKDGTMEVIDG